MLLALKSDCGIIFLSHQTLNTWVDNVKTWKLPVFLPQNQHTQISLIWLFYHLKFVGELVLLQTLQVRFVELLLDLVVVRVAD